MNQRRKISVYIPAYNEANNIANILSDIYVQRLASTSLEHVTVVCDGCTDNTVHVLKACQKQMPSLRVINHKQRLGKLARLNEIFRNNKSDLLIILDADIRLVGRDVFSTLTAPLKPGTRVAMVAANEVPVPPHSWMSRVIYRSFTNWDHVCAAVPAMDTIHSFGGAATAYRGEFARTLSIPKGALEERLYLYLAAKKYGRYVFMPQAQILYRPVSTWREWIGLTHRAFGEDDTVIEQMFRVKTTDVLHIPTKYKVAGLTKACIEDPVFALLGLLLNWLMAHYKNESRVDRQGTWEYANSTKQAIVTENLGKT